MERESSRAPRARDEIDEAAVEPEPPTDFADAAEQDFAARNVAMSNALPAGAAAGAVVGSGGDLAMDPATDEEEATERRSPSSSER